MRNAPILKGSKRTRNFDPQLKTELVDQAGHKGFAESPSKALAILKRYKHLKRGNTIERGGGAADGNSPADGKCGERQPPACVGV